MDGFDAASTAPEETLDADLMAFAARRRLRREEREAALEASLQAATSLKRADAGHIEFIEVVGPPVDDAVKVDVDVVDASASTSAGASSAKPASEPLASPVERDDYAVRRVAELSELLAQESCSITDEMRREADEARKINISAQERTKKKREGAAAKPGAKKPSAAAKTANTETKAAVKQAQ